MKQPKKLTLVQKIMIKSQGHNPGDYMFHKETEESYVFVHKETGLLLPIYK